MLWIAILTILVLATLAGVVIPFRGPRPTWATPNAGTELDRLLAEKARALRTLKDLETERVAGLVAPSEYETTRTEYIDRAVELNRAIAKLTGVDPSRMADPATEAAS